MLGSHDELKHGERAGHVVDRFHIVFAFARDVAEVLQVQADVIAFGPLEPLGQRQRPPVVRFSSFEIALGHIDQPEVVQDRHVSLGAVRPHLLQDRHGTPIDLFGAVQIARVVADARLRPETRRKPGVFRSEGVLDQLRCWTEERFGFGSLPRQVQQDRDAHSCHRRIRVAGAPRAFEDRQRSTLERLGSRVVARFESGADEIVEEHADEHVIRSTRRASPIVSARSSCSRASPNLAALVESSAAVRS